MSGIAGFCNFGVNYLSDSGRWLSLASKIGNSLSHRGSVANGTIVTEHSTFAHTHIDPQSDVIQPMVRNICGNKYIIVLDGTIFNANELREDITKNCCDLKTLSDAELILNAYVCFGYDFIDMLNGTFALAIWDENKNELLLARDKIGIKPLFYTFINETFVFASEMKALFEYPDVKPRIDNEGLTEIFALGPARTEGFGVFKNIHELKSGKYSVYNTNGYKEYRYWQLESNPHVHSYEETVEQVKYLVEDSIKRQTISDIPVCSFLSGGLDSSLVTSIASKSVLEHGFKFIDTFSFDYEENSKYFKSSNFQPDQDRPWVDKVSSEFMTNHHYLECSCESLVNLLDRSVCGRDLPGMADIDSSLFYFCSEVKKTHTVALTGECADEIFGGYPWFLDNTSTTFPWTRDLDMRKLLLSDDLLQTINIEEHIDKRYQKSISEVPILDGESREAARRREIAYLNLKWFMRTLLERMDRAACGIDARVPFADVRIVEYLWNVPWEFKYRGGVAKGLLRDVAKSFLPEDILMRKKSPFPKTYNPLYEKTVSNLLIDVLNNSNSPILPLVNKENILKLIEAPSDYGRPWFGQLMAGPQMIAYLLQINFWLKKYNLT